VSISSTFYEQLLHAWSPKVPKDTDEVTDFFAISGSASVKAARIMLMKLTPGVDFVNMFMKSFYEQRSQKRKKTFKS